MANADRAIAARYLHDALGMTWDRVGDLLHVDATTASRDAKALGELDTTPERSTSEGTESLLAGQVLDGHGEALATATRALARKIDKASASDKAQDSLALPGLTKEWRAILAEIMGASGDDKDWLSDLFK